MGNEIKANPMEIVQRHLILNELRKVNPQQVKQCDEPLTITYKDIDDDNVEKEIVEINWQFCLFGAGLHRLQELFKNFVPIKEETKPKIITS